MQLQKILLSGAAGLLLAAGLAAAAPLSKNPGATLIVPYFEVDLDAPDGRSTLISVGNAGEPVVAHATLWTDRGVPVYAWDIYLGANALVTYNLRDILVHGNLPPTAAPAAFGGCGDPVATPALGATELALLQKQLTGQDVGGNDCPGEPRPDQTLATGSITIDTVVDCRPGPNRRYPNAPGYFTGSAPQASSREVLWGDFTLVDPAENFAQGYEAHALGIASGEDSRFGGWEANPEVARETIGKDFECSRTRFLLGGPFDARTSIFVYTAPPGGLEDNECGAGPGTFKRWSFRVFDEDGGLRTLEQESPTWRTSGRFEAGVDFPTYLPSGFVELLTYVSGDWGGVPLPNTPIHHLLMGAIQASGRFAAGTLGDPIGDCTRP